MRCGRHDEGDLTDREEEKEKLHPQISQMTQIIS
jgi:hypothetical protein